MIAINQYSPNSLLSLVNYTSNPPGILCFQKYLILYTSVQTYMERYNASRPHQNLHYRTPDAYESEYYANTQLKKNLE